MTKENQNQLVARVDLAKKIVDEHKLLKSHCWPGAEMQAIYTKAVDSFNSGGLEKDEFKTVISEVDKFYVDFNGNPFVSTEVVEMIVGRKNKT